MKTHYQVKEIRPSPNKNLWLSQFTVDYAWSYNGDTTPYWNIGTYLPVDMKTESSSAPLSETLIFQPLSVFFQVHG
jgi:hypothetical protein